MVKVPPPSLGVGMYQHDIKEKILEQRLGNVLEEVVSEIGSFFFPLLSHLAAGVDVNTASLHVLSYASGINKSQAAAIITHRSTRGPFRSREEIQKVKGIGKISYQNAAGFLRIMDGDEPLDSTIVHPEKYSVLKSLLSLIISSPPSTPLASESTLLPKKRKKPSSQSGAGRLLSNEEIKQLLFTQQLRDQFRHCNWSDLSSQLQEDIDSLKLLSRWITDPLFNASHDLDLRGRKGIPPYLARKCLLSPEDYQPGLIVQGIVRNITSFGTFVDIGAEEDGFLHKSKYGSRGVGGFVIGEMIHCQVLLIDKERGGKISLGLIEDRRVAPISVTDGRSEGVPVQTGEESKRATTSDHEETICEQQVGKRSRLAKNS